MHVCDRSGANLRRELSGVSVRAHGLYTGKPVPPPEKCQKQSRHEEIQRQKGQARSRHACLRERGDQPDAGNRKTGRAVCPETACCIKGRSQQEGQRHAQHVAAGICEKPAESEMPGTLGRTGGGVRQGNQHAVQRLRSGGQEREGALLLRGLRGRTAGAPEHRVQCSQPGTRSAGGERF